MAVAGPRRGSRFSFPATPGASRRKALSFRCLLLWGTSCPVPPPPHVPFTQRSRKQRRAPPGDGPESRTSTEAAGARSHHELHRPPVGHQRPEGRHATYSGEWLGWWGRRGTEGKGLQAAWQRPSAQQLLHWGRGVHRERGRKPPFRDSCTPRTMPAPPKAPLSHLQPFGGKDSLLPRPLLGAVEEESQPPQAFLKGEIMGSHSQ